MKKKMLRKITLTVPLIFASVANPLVAQPFDNQLSACNFSASGLDNSVTVTGRYGCGDRKSASAAAGLAVRNTGSPAGYVTSGTGNCLLIPNINACFNSSGC